LAWTRSRYASVEGGTDDDKMASPQTNPGTSVDLPAQMAAARSTQNDSDHATDARRGGCGRSRFPGEGSTVWLSTAESGYISRLNDLRAIDSPLTAAPAKSLPWIVLSVLVGQARRTDRRLSLLCFEPSHLRPAAPVFLRAADEALPPVSR